MTTRHFELERQVDVTGVSGTGVVAEGIEFTDGTCAMRWTTADKPPSTVLYANITDLETIHGHDGRTRVVWVEHPDRIREYADAQAATARQLDTLAGQLSTAPGIDPAQVQGFRDTAKLLTTVTDDLYKILRGETLQKWAIVGDLPGT